MSRFNIEALNIPLDRVAEALGMQKGGKDMWFSPMRDESEASLHIDLGRNLWYDFGAGMGGTNVQLIMLARHCGKREAYRFLDELDPSASLRNEHAPAPVVQKDGPLQVQDINGYYIKKYLAERKIPLNLAQEYLKEIKIFSPQKGFNFTYVGIPNNAGGYAMSSPGGFKRTDKASATMLNMDGKLSTVPSSKSVAVFEGFFDFLSWQVLQSSIKPNCDIVVLNSVNNLKTAADYIAAHDKVLSFMDHDEAGQKCKTAIESIRDGQEVTDMSIIYRGFKDLNEKLQHSRGYSADMKLSLNL